MSWSHDGLKISADEGNEAKTKYFGKLRTAIPHASVRLFNFGYTQEFPILARGNLAASSLSTYFASRSTSRFTACPDAARER